MWCIQRADMFSVTVVTIENHNIFNDHHISTWLPQELQRSWNKTAGENTCWRLKSSQLWHCVFGWRPSNVSIHFSFYCQKPKMDCLTLQIKTLKPFKCQKYSPNTASHPEELGLWEHKCGNFKSCNKIYICKQRIIIFFQLKFLCTWTCIPFDSSQGPTKWWRVMWWKSRD